MSTGTLDFGEDCTGHDTDCDCKACLIYMWHAEVDELGAEVERLRLELGEARALGRDYWVERVRLRKALREIRDIAAREWQADETNYEWYGDIAGLVEQTLAEDAS